MFCCRPLAGAVDASNLVLKNECSFLHALWLRTSAAWNIDEALFCNFKIAPIGTVI